MSGAAAFNIAMVFKADAAQAKGATVEVVNGLKAVTTEAANATAAGARQSNQLNVLAGASGKAASATLDLGSAAASCARIWQTSGTAADSLRTAVAGLNNSVGQLDVGMIDAGMSAMQYRAALDEVRASFNPLFAASRQYEQQLDRIAEAERIGAINAREAAEARRRAVSIISGPTATSGAMPANINGMHTANIGAQGFDIGVTAAMGMNPAMIGFQQGSQLVQVIQQMGGGKNALRGIATGFMSILSPMSLVTIGMVALGAAGIQALTKLGGETKTLGEALEDLSGSTDAYAKSSERARMGTAALQAEFGSASEVARRLLQDMAELDRRAAGRGLSDSIAALPREFGVQTEDYAVPGASDLKSLFDVSGWDRDGMSRILGIESAMKWSIDAKGVEQQTRAVETLRDRWIEMSEASGGDKTAQDEGLRQINTLLEALTSLQALDENAAGNARADEMVRQLQQRIALEQVSLRYGQDSAEYRAEEARQTRENTLLELESVGIARDSEKARAVLLNLARATLQADAQAKQAREDAHKAYLGEQDSQIAAMNRELALLGASNDERIRANALAEAQAQSLKDNASIEEERLNQAKALAKAEAQITLEREKSRRALQHQLQIDAIESGISLSRDPITRATLEAEREYARVLNETNDAEYAAAEANRIRARAVTETLNTARVQAADMLDEVVIRQQVSAQVAAGTVAADDANRVIQQELQLRPLLAAAARAEGEEKARLTGVITTLRLAYEAQAAEARRAAQNDYLRSSAERVQQAQLELALIGQTAETRARILALVQAEREIRAQGLTGEFAEQARENAREMIELNRQIAAQADAWQTVQSAGESAIDAVLDKLQDGDIAGAFAGLLDELNKGFFDLAVRNPLKNLLLGTDLGTLDDVGGLSGIWDRLTGKAKVDEAAVIRNATQQVQAMQVAATAVTINAASIGLGNAQSLLGGMPGAVPGVANQNVSPLSNSNGVAGQIWDFFSGKGLAPHQVAAIVGHAKAESGLNPLAVGDGGNAHGLFQWNDRRHSLFDFIGGKQNLGNINGQLEFAWKELMTSENGAFRRLQAAPDLASATWAWQGFERPSGYDPKVFGSGMHFDQRLSGAQQALVTFTNAANQAVPVVTEMGQTTQTATTQVGNMANGMGQFGGLLGQLAQGVAGSVGGEGGGILSMLLGIGGQLANGAKLFNVGGYTGAGNPDDPAGIVHRDEYVFDAVSTRRIGVSNLEKLRQGTLRGFRSGGYVGSAPTAEAPYGWQGFAANENVTFAPNFDLRYSTDPAETEAAAKRGMEAALANWERTRMPGRMRQMMQKPRNI